MNNTAGNTQRAPVGGAGGFVGRRPGRPGAAWIVVLSMIATMLPVVFARTAFGAPLPDGAVDWDAAKRLMPLEGSGGTAPGLSTDGVAPLVCADEGACLATTVRPELEATIEPDPDIGYSFVVYDLSGAGGLEVAAASVYGHDSNTWAPQAGLLQHGRVYAWTVSGDEDDEDEQGWGVFAVDLQRQVDQAFDAVGPFSVGMSTGELVVDHPLGSPDDDYPLNVEYRGTDSTGRQAGATPLHVVSDAWALSGAALGEASWYALDTYADGDTIVANAIDGTSLRYDRDADGDYQPPQIDGLDLSFMYPVLETRPDGTFVMSELDGSVTTFTSLGLLDSFELPAREGGAAVSLDVTWTGGRLREVSDPIMGRTATFTYLDDRECRPGPGFDTGSATPALCSVTTFSGETIELWYLDGALSRLVGAGGEVTDFAYDDAGNLTTVRESLAADAVAAGVVANDSTVTWQIDYDADGKVAGVTSPEPLPGDARTVRTYDYRHGETTIAENGIERGTVTFDPADYRVLEMHTAEADAPFVRLYDEDRTPIGFVDERGLQTSWATDAAGNIVESWGPAPQAWFGSDGRPLAAHADEVATVTTAHGAGSGMLAFYTDGMAVDGALSAQALLDSSTIETLPTAVDAGNGWRMTAIGDALLPLEGDVDWRFNVDDAADPAATQLLVNNVLVAPGEVVEIPGPEDADPEGQAYELWVVYVSDTAPTPSEPARFSIEYAGADGWVVLDPIDMIGQDHPSATTSLDVYGAGQAPTVVTTSMVYADPLLGLVGSYETGGQSTTASYEPANPIDGEYARMRSFTNQGGVGSTISYWGADDTAVHPISGEALPQYGRFRAVQTGTDAERGMIFDAAGRVVAYTADGAVTTAVTYDVRSRVDRIELRDDPLRTTEYRFGAGGDPRVTGAVSTVDGDLLTAVTTVDLLGRVVSEVDVWGTTTTTTYDVGGIATNVVVTTASGATSTTDFTVGADRLLRMVSVDGADGSTFTATVTGHDAAGRITGVEYSNGVSVSVEYDAASGMVSAHRWTDGDGGAWVDEVTRTTQTGRILRHALDHPSGSAHVDYTYDASTGALTAAGLTGTGDGPVSTDWAYAYDAGARTQRVTTTADGSTTLDYSYDANQAPVAVAETTVPTDGQSAVRDIPVAFDGADLVAFDTVDLDYDPEGLLTRAGDGGTTIELLRDATGVVVGQHVTADGMTTTYRYSGPFVLDETGATLAQVVTMPGGVSVVAPIDDGEVVWHMATLAGDPWWTSDSAGTPVGDATHFSPDGEQLTGAAADPTAIDATNGWRSGHGGVTLALDTSVTLFGARAYIPALGMFTTTDPMPGAGPTPYSYADNDPVNRIDPTGNSSEGPFDNWNSWGSQLVITIGLTVLAILLVMAGQPHGAAAMMLVLAGYLGALSVDSFIQGDIAGGILYAIAAVLVLVGGVKLGVKSSTMRTQLVHRTSTSQSQSLVSIRTPVPSVSTSSSHYLSGSQSVRLPAAAHYLRMAQQQQAMAYNNVMAAFGGVGGGAAGAGAVSFSFAVKASVYTASIGLFFGLGFLKTTPDQW